MECKRFFCKGIRTHHQQQTAQAPCAIEYPPIFDKRRVDIKKALLKAIDEIGDDDDKTDKAGVFRDLLKGRLLNNTWPIRTRLELFAKAFGVKLQGTFHLLKEF